MKTISIVKTLILLVAVAAMASDPSNEYGTVDDKNMVVVAKSVASGAEVPSIFASRKICPLSPIELKIDSAAVTSKVEVERSVQREQELLSGDATQKQTGTANAKNSLMSDVTGNASETTKQKGEEIKLTGTSTRNTVESASTQEESKKEIKEERTQNARSTLTIEHTRAFDKFLKLTVSLVNKYPNNLLIDNVTLAVYLDDEYIGVAEPAALSNPTMVPFAHSVPLVFELPIEDETLLEQATNVSSSRISCKLQSSHCKIFDASINGLIFPIPDSAILFTTWQFTIEDNIWRISPELTVGDAINTYEKIAIASGKPHSLANSSVTFFECDGVAIPLEAIQNLTPTPQQRVATRTIDEKSVKESDREYLNRQLECGRTSAQPLIQQLDAQKKAAEREAAEKADKEVKAAQLQAVQLQIENERKKAEADRLAKLNRQYSDAEKNIVAALQAIGSVTHEWADETGGGVGGGNEHQYGFNFKIVDIVSSVKGNELIVSMIYEGDTKWDHVMKVKVFGKTVGTRTNCHPSHCRGTITIVYTRNNGTTTFSRAEYSPKDGNTQEKKFQELFNPKIPK